MNKNIWNKMTGISINVIIKVKNFYLLFNYKLSKKQRETSKKIW